jgi:DNA-binding winged helix-turn-helix (wHTH) protein
VLALLAVRANLVVSRDEIIDGVWGDRPPASAVNGVHVHVGALRQALVDVGARPVVLIGSRPAECGSGAGGC